MMRYIFFFLAVLGWANSYAQVDPSAEEKASASDTSRFMEAIPQAFSEVPHFTFGRGIGIHPADSSFSFNLRFRMQNRAGVLFNEAADTEIEARVRRLRLRFDGFVFNPRFYYVIQLSFSRGDMDWENTEFANVLRDAMFFYRANDKLQFGFGQTKLPGNRQRVISSGDLQFVDRSIVNAEFNVDRDFGAQVAYTERLFSNFHTVLRGAITSGEGRNIISTSNGLAYTGRIELLPFGLFEKFGDYFEGDLIREKKPKLSAGFTFSQNNQTLRTGGQIGQALFEPRDMNTLSSDWLLKYRGFALAIEYMYRTSEDPITQNLLGEVRYVYTGFGQNYQASYFWPNNYELAVRYSHMNPSSQIQQFERDIQQYTIGVSKYLKGHRLKLQSDITFEQRKSDLGLLPPGNSWMIRFQIELGI
jgi:phosphate-selective porin OprO/OprP